MEAVHARHLLLLAVGNAEPIANGDAADHEDLVLEHNFADRFDLVALGIDLDLTRLQRAGERARQSAAGRGHHVVKCGRMGRVPIWAHAVVLGHL
jgi:hypothetical protein